MVYDQAQSPRLGQRVPIENTYVQVFDVTADNATADLVEAAWPGMLIYRNDTSMLMIYDGWEDPPHWREVAGGVPGAATYVGTGMPTGTDFNIGDTWYDSDNGMKAYVWDGSNWVPVTGEGGVKTFRQPSPPMTTAIGDFWIDSDDHEKLYTANAVGFSDIVDATHPSGWVLIQDSHTAQVTADVKTRAYYADGFLPDDGDPDTPRVLAPLSVAPDGKALTAGDIWYQTDNNNWCRFFTGNLSAGVGGWVDVVDPNVYTAINQGSINTGNIETLLQQINELQGLSYSANNTADTADGRISTSDYRPDKGDLKYIQYRTVFDPDTGEASQVPYEVYRTDGSIWFTQTRKRFNKCTNPSMEVNLVGWAADHASLLRVNPPIVPAGDWTMEVTIDATSTDHYVTWGDPNGSPPATPAVAVKGQVWSASIYAEMLDDSVGAGVQIELMWTDEDGAFISSETSEPYQLVKDAYTPTVPDTTVDWRMWVSGTAPEETAGVYVRLVVPAGNEGDVYHAGALLLEAEPDLGKYFDGDSYDGFWDGVEQNSTSRLTDTDEDGGKIYEIWELRRGGWSQKKLADWALAPMSTQNLYGTLSSALIGVGSISQTKHFAGQVQAMENLDYGDIVHLYNDLGVFMARKADARVDKNYEAHGFVWDTVTAGQPVRVYHFGYVDYPAGAMVPGAQWLSTTPGKTQRKPPNTPGVLVQQVGFAASAKIFNFEPHLAIKIN